MEMKLLSKDDERIVLLVKDADVTSMNTLRRLIMNNVPTLAIEDVTFLKNSSAMYDEFIAHRLGLVALKTDLKSYTMPDKCKCKGKGCAHCQLVMSLKAQGPGTVYAEEISSKDPKVKPVFAKTLIVKLLKKQVLEFDAIAVLGTGKDHMKFSPGLVYYQSYPIIKVGNVKNPEEIAAVCPTKVFEVKNGKLVVDEEKCILCLACAEASSEIKIDGSKKDFIFTVESYGQLSPNEMVTKAFDVFDEKLDEFAELVGDLK
ncbi:MAG: DNA-directed RNA polymerase subunit D [archaeon]